MLCSSGLVSQSWIESGFGKFLSAVRVKKYPGQRQVGLLFTAGWVKAHLNSTPLISKSCYLQALFQKNFALFLAIPTLCSNHREGFFSIQFKVKENLTIKLTKSLKMYKSHWPQHDIFTKKAPSGFLIQSPDKIRFWIPSFDWIWI